MRNGILVGGNWIIDQVKIIDTFPEEEKLVTIFSECLSNGGSAYNILKDLVKLQADFPLSGLGLVGDDERGEYIINECEELEIDTTQLRKILSAYTSYTDVMTVKSSGKRTFFHQRGANALLDIDHFDFSISNAKMFHLGYLLLLDKLDILESDGLTRAARVLKRAKSFGFITSVDVVSEDSDRFSSLIPPALPYIDYLFVNEYEACMITGIATSIGGEPNRAYCQQAALKIIEMGVNRWVVVHFPSGAIAVSSTSQVIFQPSINIPEEMVVGAVGAGDAFAAGVLLGVHNEQSMEKSLKLGICAAASSLFASTSSDGILTYTECLFLDNKFGYRSGF
ncbi:carbohydrate kinase family protein [Pedobacter sp. JCM 36344]|uniref:carbohydrate kinase family protein n=1 Tax=Pedobacter sp. JCM 36344 TaxID=3374280 RepID=UPI00397DD3AF